MSSSSNSDDSDTEEYRATALPVSALPANFDPSKAPTTAEEYLHQVMHEAKKYKGVKTVTLEEGRRRPAPVVVRRPTKAECSPSYLPAPHHQTTILQEFAAAVAKVERLRKAPSLPAPPAPLPPPEDPQAWRVFCYGGGGAEAHPPLMSTILNIKQAVLHDLLEWSVGWLREGFSVEQGRWLYALLSCVVTPLTPEMGDTVRQCVLVCSQLRAQLDSPSHPHLAALNLLITICSRHFSQQDLADPY